MPQEMLTYQYQKLFNLSYEQVQAEPAHVFFTNLRIWGLIEEKKAIDSKNVNRQR